MVDLLTDLKNMATVRSGKGKETKDSKKYMQERLHNTKKSFFNFPLKE